jgi:hypothetical protein
MQTRLFSCRQQDIHQPQRASIERGQNARGAASSAGLFSLNPTPTANEFNAGPVFNPWSPDHSQEPHYGLEHFQGPYGVRSIPANLDESANVYAFNSPGFDFTASGHDSMNITPYIDFQGSYGARPWSLDPAQQVDQVTFTPSGFQLNALGQGFNERTLVTETMNIPLTGGTNHNLQPQVPTTLLAAGLPTPQLGSEQPSAVDTTLSNSGKERITCYEEGCTKTFGRAAEYRRHKKTAHSPPKFQCVFFGCKKTFSRADKLGDHLRKGHKHTGLPGYLKQMLS